METQLNVESDTKPKRTGKPHTAESIAKLKASLKAKWASGTRKANPHDMYERTSKLMKEAYASGKRTCHLTRDDALRACAARDMKKVREACRKTGKAKLGVPNPPGKSEAGPENWKAKEWAIRSPDGIILQGKNLNHIIRENAHLFSPSDVAWKKSQCLASKRISSLFLTKSDGKTPCALSWKGWTPISKVEREAPTPQHLGKIVNLPAYATKKLAD